MFSSSLSRMVLAASIWLFIMLALAGTYLWQWLNDEQFIPADKRMLTVEKGQGSSAVAKYLQQQGLLRWPVVWRAYNRFVQLGTIKAGEYALSPYESPISVLSLLQGGEVISYNLTIAEGLTLKEWLAIMAKEDKLKPVAAHMTPAQLAEFLELDTTNPEGWFFPDTYRYQKGNSDLDILIRAHEKMKIELASHWARRRPSLPYRDSYDVLIMASIIEKETGVARERAEISGVFVRRLERKMRLQTDPTVIYGLGDEYQGRLRKKHLQTPTPYNTYVIAGLPPTPIANPGRQALDAAVNPASGHSLFFVAKGDGSHQFSRTLVEHNRAVDQYQRQRRAGYTSTVKASPIASLAASSVQLHVDVAADLAGAVASASSEAIPQIYSSSSQVMSNAAVSSSPNSSVGAL